MSRISVLDARFVEWLVEVDRQSAFPPGGVGDCPACGGALHQAHYDRKSRWWPPGSDQVEGYDRRFSFCCAREGCRKRQTPPSVRFLGRRVYLGVMVVLIAAMTHGVTTRRCRSLCDRFGIDRRTLCRWREWWQTFFARSECRLAEPAAAAIPAVELPRALLMLFCVEGRGLRERMVERVKKMLLLLQPLTTRSWGASGQPAF